MTGQVHEILVLDGKKTSMEFCPPLPKDDPRILPSEHGGGSNSACWRGYRGSWEIKDGEFFLIGLSGKYRLREEIPIPAKWVSGIIQVSLGEVLRYIHYGITTATVYEQELHIKIKEGMVVETSTIDNRSPFSEETRFKIEGSWKSGMVLDWHTTESHAVGENEYGHTVFETTRTELGELLYQFKYRSNRIALNSLIKLASSRLSVANGKFDLIVPIPPSSPKRTVTSQIAAGLAPGLAAAISLTALTKVRETDELKSVTDPEKRRELLAGAFSADKSQIHGKKVLLVDDLYRSGATLEAATDALYHLGGAAAVYVFAITRTRVNR